MQPFRFLFMADCQFGSYASFSGMDEADVERFAARDMQVVAAPRVEGFAWDARQYERAVAMANDLAPAFVMMGGDMVDQPDDLAAHDALMAITERLDPPMHWVPGNHDVDLHPDAPPAAHPANYRRRFGPDHYALTHDGATIIVVDTVVWVGADQAPGVYDEQVSALRGWLEEATDRAGPTVVCGHHPLFTVDADEPDSYWNVPRARREPLLDLLADHGVTTYLSGHWHRNGGGRYRDLDVVVTGPVGYPLGDDPSGFRVVEVSGDGVAHEYVALREHDGGS